LNLPHVRHKRTLVTAHDFLAIQASRGDFPGWNVGWSGRRYQQMIVRAVQDASAIACVSETTRKAMRIYLSQFPGEIRTILNGMYRPYHRLDHEEAKARLGAKEAPKFEQFFLHVGGTKPYKNRVGVLKIFAELARQAPELKAGLVMAGGAPDPDMLA